MILTSNWNVPNNPSLTHQNFHKSFQNLSEILQRGFSVYFRHEILLAMSHGGHSSWSTEIISIEAHQPWYVLLSPCQQPLLRTASPCPTCLNLPDTSSLIRNTPQWFTGTWAQKGNTRLNPVITAVLLKILNRFSKSAVLSLLAQRQGQEKMMVI